MNRVYRYKIEIGHNGPVVIDMPLGAQIIHVETQHGVPCLWAVVDPDALPVEREFEVYGTGHRMREATYTTEAGNQGRTALIHRGTFMLEDGGLVFHLFERQPL